MGHLWFQATNVGCDIRDQASVPCQGMGSMALKDTSVSVSLGCHLNQSSSCSFQWGRELLRALSLVTHNQLLEVAALSCIRAGTAQFIVNNLAFQFV